MHYKWKFYNSSKLFCNYNFLFLFETFFRTHNNFVFFCIEIMNSLKYLYIDAIYVRWNSFLSLLVYSEDNLVYFRTSTFDKKSYRNYIKKTRKTHISVTYVSRLKNSPIILKSPRCTKLELYKKDPSFPVIIPFSIKWF